MVYVHSKLMVVDDKVMIVGSANINMRSLAGTRDTEIGVLLSQPSYDVIGKGSDAQLPHGHVHGFRMSLFFEHLKSVYPDDEDLLRDPSTLECSRFIQQRAQVSSRSCYRTLKTRRTWPGCLKSLVYDRQEPQAVNSCRKIGTSLSILEPMRTQRAT